MSRAYAATSSAPRRERVNASVGWPSATKRAKHASGLHVGRSTYTGVFVEERPLPDREAPGTTRCAVVVDRRDGEAAQLGGQLTRVADGCAREAERRRGSIVLTEASQPAEHVGDVAPEDAAQGVQLVDHHVPEPEQEVGPTRVRREDPHVEHLGIGEDHVGVLAGPGPVVGGGVTVVGDSPQSGHQPGPQRAELVLRERLRREHEQRGLAPVRHHRFDDRDLVAE